MFGGVDQLEPELLAQLLTQMRANLGGVWRLPAVQEQAKTKRRQEDIQTEVLKGYDAALQTAMRGVEQHPDDWRLIVALAALQLDLTTYKNQLAPSSDFADERLTTMQLFEAAAKAYADEVADLKQDEQEATVYEQWFYAGLGASDISGIDDKSVADPRQPALIRAAIEALPGEAAEHHMGLFANSLFTRMSGLKPQMKFPYLKAGFEIVADNERAAEARKVYDYYSDLVTEIELVTRLDGPPQVGSNQPFGVFVDLRHTIEIERESGGFGKYLQNQNSMSFAWNYGRPLENYRDKFEESARTALGDHFDVLSITFEDPEVHSRADAEYGWRVTPYAYLLLEPKGPEIDKLPALKIDLDFLDTTGFAVLPVVSSPVQIDVTGDNPPVRPYGNVRITQTLDERQAAEGKLLLEVKVTANGLVPEIEELLTIGQSDFTVAQIEDEGLLVSKFDDESSEPAILSERLATIHYVGRDDLGAIPTSFTFPQPKGDVAENSWLRYEDADLKSVEQVVSLEREYGEVKATWPYWLAGGLVVLALGGVFWRLLRGTAVDDVPVSQQLPERITPFNLLTMLREVEARNGFNPQEQQELSSTISQIERTYFAGEANGNGHDELRQLAQRWVGKSRV
ncbi:MAG: hypothetical protein R3B90_07785 [Planctomycetaceae bacterium]